MNSYAKAMASAGKDSAIHAEPLAAPGCFDNLLEGLVLSHINEAWSSDISYYEVTERFYCLTFIMDCFPEGFWAIHSVPG